jgi:uncharacterized membrane protein
MMTLRLFLVGLFAAIVLFSGVYSLLMPGLTRRDVFFGVTVMPNARATPVGRRILARYRLAISLATLATLGLLAIVYAAVPDDWLLRPWVSAGILLVLACTALPYLLAHRASRALAATATAAHDLTAPAAELHPRRYADAVPWVWELLPAALIAATTVYLGQQYAGAPAVIPTHFDFNGHANAFAPKSIGSFFALVWVQLFMAVFLTGIALLLIGSKAIPGQAEERFRRIWLRVLFGIKTLTIAYLGLIAALIGSNSGATTLSPALLFIPAAVFLLLVLGGLTVVAVRTGQGGSRLGTPEETATDRMNDRYWKLGVIYVNRDDPSVFVEQRFGIGWTLNVGNPRGVLALVALLAAPLALVVLLVVVSQPR